MTTKTINFSHGLTADARKRLLEHFQGEGPPANDRWASLWNAGDFLPWDRGVPHPGLVDTLTERKELLGDSVFIRDLETGMKRRKLALVPGCGRGYDVLLLASFGYDAYGLEVSAEAVKQADAWAKDHMSEYPVNDEVVGAGKAKFVEGDFFSDEWSANADGVNKFELLYDYTFFCALSPSLRPSWALRHSELLSPHPESCLICVEFPTYKEMSTGGPPWSAPSSAYLAHLSNPGLQIPYDDAGNAPATSMQEDRHGLKRVAHWQPTRTHEVGKGTDWISVWKKPGHV